MDTICITWGFFLRRPAYGRMTDFCWTFPSFFILLLCQNDAADSRLCRSGRPLSGMYVMKHVEMFFLIYIHQYIYLYVYLLCWLCIYIYIVYVRCMFDICIFVCVNILTDSQTPTRTHANTHTCMHTHRTHTHTHAQACTWTHTNTQDFMLTCASDAMAQKHT